MIEAKTESAFHVCMQKPLVLVDFYASWCGPCKVLSPVLEKMSKSPRYANVVFLKVDVDKLDAITDKYHVTAMPTIVLFSHGRELGRVTGADSVKIEALLQKYVTH